MGRPDGITIGLAVIALANGAMAIIGVATNVYLWLAAVNIAVAIYSAFNAGRRWTLMWAAEQFREDAKVTAGLPAKITLGRDDEGRCTVFITTIGGDPVVLSVPDEVAAHGPHAAVLWALSNAPFG